MTCDLLLIVVPLSKLELSVL